MSAKRAIAFVMNELTDYSYEISVGAHALLAERGYHCIAVTGKHLDDPSSSAHNPIYQTLHSTQFAGALIYSLTLENRADPVLLPALLKPLADLPLVSIGAKLLPRSNIVVDHALGMTQLMDHLIAQARFQQFLFVRGVPTNADSLHREEIFTHRLRRHGLATAIDFVNGNFDGDVVYREIYARFRRTHGVAQIPTAIVCANDRMAVAAIEALQDLDLRIPEDVAVTGFDNSPECAQSSVPLTTVGQPLYAMGETAAQMLLAQFAGRDVPDLSLSTGLIVRASCGGMANGAVVPTVGAARPAGNAKSRQRTGLKQRDYLSHIVTNLNIKLMEQTTLPDLRVKLLSLFPTLGIIRCLVVLYEERAKGDDASAQLFLAYDENDPTLAAIHISTAFNRRDRLWPENLAITDWGECAEMTPLVSGGDCFGYMIFSWSLHYFTDFLLLPVLIASAVRNIYQLQRLQEYASSLEQKVEERTRKLRIMNRRLQHEVVERRNSEFALREANETLTRLATIDGLTQLENRTTLDEYLQRQCDALAHAALPLSFLLADIDYFKNYNDTYGHQAGDTCLR
ncbi:MAG: substrate-binding domain-containing protein, partial [Caldilineaceae bacterium]|nr:substrate-binding domain-containing protein [Caldilineaceae bacterium]